MNDAPQSFMARFGSTLIENGYAVIPIMPGAKKPGRHQNGVWGDYPDWTRHCDRPTKTFEIGIWKLWPGCAVGIACGTVIGIDIDVLDGTVALELEQMARSMLGDTRATRIGRAPKRMLIYRSDRPFRGRKRHPIEVLGQGQQFLAYAIHPETQRPYEWPSESLVELDIGSLPEITEAQALAFLEAAYQALPEHLRKASLEHDAPRSEWAGPSDPRGTLAAISAALEHIPNAELDWDSWIRIGLAIKGALGEEGRDLWCDWSRRAAKSGKSGKPDTPEREWKGFRPKQIGAGTIYYLAEQNGWVPAPELILNAGAAQQAGEPHAAAALIAKLNARVAERAAKPLPVAANLFDVEGALKLFVDHCEATAMSSQPFLALAAAIVLVGTLAGRKYRTATDLRTNIYAVGVADSGAGKDWARKQIKVVLAEAGLTNYLGGEDIASGAALFTALSRHPAVLFQIDEFGDWLADVLGPKAASHRKQLAQRLKTLYSSASTFLSGTEYADQTRQGRPREDIQQPHACLYGTTTPGQLWSAIAGASMHDGLMARILLFVSPVSYPDETDPSLGKPSAELIAAIKEIAEGPADPQTGELGRLMLSTTNPEPVLVPNSEAAEQAWRALRKEQLVQQRRAEGTYVTAIAGRLAENAMKLALVRAVSRDPALPQIEAVDVAWGRAVATHCIDTLLREADRHVADNEYDGRLKRAAEIIRKHGPITESEMIRKGFKVSERDRAEVLRTLIQSAEVIALASDPSAKGGRPTVRYAINPSASETSEGRGYDTT